MTWVRFAKSCPGGTFGDRPINFPYDFEKIGAKKKWVDGDRDVRRASV